MIVPWVLVNFMSVISAIGYHFLSDGKLRDNLNGCSVQVPCMGGGMNYPTRMYPGWMRIHCNHYWTSMKIILPSLDMFPLLLHLGFFFRISKNDFFFSSAVGIPMFKPNIKPWIHFLFWPKLFSVGKSFHMLINHDNCHKHRIHPKFLVLSCNIPCQVSSPWCANSPWLRFPSMWRCHTLVPPIVMLLGSHSPYLVTW